MRALILCVVAALVAAACTDRDAATRNTTTTEVVTDENATQPVAVERTTKTDNVTVVDSDKTTKTN
jgi:hypothetical protein